MFLFFVQYLLDKGRIPFSVNSAKSCHSSAKTTDYLLFIYKMFVKLVPFLHSFCNLRTTIKHPKRRIMPQQRSIFYFMSSFFLLLTTTIFAQNIRTSEDSLLFMQCAKIPMAEPHYTFSYTGNILDLDYESLEKDNFKTLDDNAAESETNKPK